MSVARGRKPVKKYCVVGGAVTASIQGEEFKQTEFSWVTQRG